jgi:hypothetical protein
MTRGFAGLALVTVASAALLAAGVRAAPWTHPTVADYVVRVVRATGEEGHVGPGAPPSVFLRHLVRQGYLRADIEPTLSLSAPLTREVALHLSVAFVHTALPAPAFLSETYVASTLAAAQATALGIVRADDETLGMRSVFGTKVEEPEKKCPTPRKRMQRKCPKPK